VIRVFLADDHPVVRDGLKALIDSQPGMCVVGEATDGLEAVEGVLASKPDVVVMDVSMPRLGGAEATARILRSCPDVKVLALTAHEERGYIRLLLEAGASGYVLKRAAAGDLVRAIEAVTEGGVYLDPTMASEVLPRLIRRTHGDVSTRGELSEREAEVLRLIAQGHAAKEIAMKLSVSARTVETYKTRAMQKLALKSRADIVRYAIDRGWLGSA
jgi:DNA-binding NarL/FixJ family response regulator